MLAELNPRLVTLAISGFGHDGPEGGRAGYDQIAQGEGGLMSLTGSAPDDPQRVGVPIGDLLAGMYGAYGVLAALLERERTGRGQVVRTSLLAAIVGVHAFQGTAWTVAGKVGRAQGNHHPSIAPVRAVPLRGRQRAAVLRPARGCGAGCAPSSASTPRRPGMATNGERVEHRERGDRAARGRLRRHRRRGPAGPAGEGRHPGGQGAHHRRGLRLGPGAVPGPARRRRARHRSAGCRCPGRRCGSSRRVRTARPRRPAASTPLPRCSAPTATRSAPGCPTAAASQPTATTSRTGTPRERRPPARLDARTLRDLVLDPGSWQSWDSPVPPRDGRRRLRRASWPAAAERTRQDESIITGEGTLRGRRVAVVAGEFGFLAGSIGVAAAERLIAAVERATEEGLPLLAAPVSGGTRMQEGTVAFLQMIGITAAIARHKEAGLPYLVYLRNPDVRRGAGLLGVAGARDDRRARRLDRVPRPAGLRGAVRRAVPRGRADRRAPRRARADRRRRPARGDRRRRRPGAAGAGRPRRPGTSTSRGAERPTAEDGTDADDPEDGRTAWDVVTASRRPDRPGVRRLLRTAATDVVGLSGTGAGEKDPGLLLALARFGGAPCVVLGQDRRGQSLSAPLGPAALREARRGMQLAEELRLPLVTLIDTPGAALSREAEEGGLAGEIARCLQDLVMLRAPTLAVLLGQGTGGGALALVPADRVLAAANGWLGPLPPGGRLGDRAPRRRPRRGDGRRRRACGRPTCGGPASSTGSCPSGRTPPTSRSSSACGWAGCSARSWPGCWAATTSSVPQPAAPLPAPGPLSPG